MSLTLDKTARKLHKARTSRPKSDHKKTEFDDSFVDYVVCEIDTEKVNPDDAWQCKPILLEIEGVETEIRRDYIFDEYVVIAPKRGKRPYDTHKNRHPLIETADSPRLDLQKEIFSLRQGSDWLVKVVENKFPALTPDNPKAYGQQEIVVDTPLANTSFAQLPISQIEHILKVYQLRTEKLMKDDNVAYVLVFRNDGFEAGASLAHAHSQIFALPIIPKRFMDHSKQIEDYFMDKKKEPIEDIIQFERVQKQRVIAEDDYFFVMCPYASQYPFEVWLIPKQHTGQFNNLNNAQLRSCAKHLKHLTGKLTNAQISYNFFIENGVSPRHRCIIKLYGRSNLWGGFETATGIVINSVPPESAARWYKNKDKRA